MRIVLIDDHYHDENVKKQASTLFVRQECVFHSKITRKRKANPHNQENFLGAISANC